MRGALLLGTVLLAVCGAAIAAPPRTNTGTTVTSPAGKTPERQSVDYPKTSITACVTEIRYQTYKSLHSITGFAKSADGRTHSFYIGAAEAWMIVGKADGSIVPLGEASAPFAPDAEPGMARFLMTAAEAGAWVRFDLEASTKMAQKVDTILRDYDKASGDCRESF
ncbi:MAG TPA: hypothetical protein VNH64_03985 [Parvularculaceae bacterium]|nr:hypothetical protein [Parvularculaceae bacterium]